MRLPWTVNRKAVLWSKGNEQSLLWVSSGTQTAPTNWGFPISNTGNRRGRRTTKWLQLQGLNATPINERKTNKQTNLKKNKTQHSLCTWMNKWSASFKRWGRRRKKPTTFISFSSWWLFIAVWFFIPGTVSTYEFTKMDFYALNESLKDL